jgi:aldose sugar dehydrogenase
VSLNVWHIAFLFNAIIFGILITFMLLSSSFYPFTNPLEAYSSTSQSSEELSRSSNQSLQMPRIYDIDLKAEIVTEGLDLPTSMAFLGPDDILVLEKDTGNIKRIINGTILAQPALDVNVANVVERGMLGIAITRSNYNLTQYEIQNKTEINLNNDNRTYIFLYFTESHTNDGEDVSNDTQTGTVPLGNRLYRYEFLDNKLVNPKLLLDLPATPGPAHNGGRITIGPDNNVYFTVGDMNFPQRVLSFTRAENVEKGEDPDGRAGILRVTLDGQPLQDDSLIGDKYPLNLYYAYGLRNSFGIDFDPLTNKLWDTENGDRNNDEINLVQPGFNSGWNKVQGAWENDGGPDGPIMSDTQERNMLVDFDGQGKYSDPELIWEWSVGPTALKFLDSKIYGKKYANDMFVGDFHNGFLYHFDLNKNRTELLLEGELQDKIMNKVSELGDTLLGQGFGGITDMEVGPDGYLYILTWYQNGTIFRIVPDPVTSISIG